VPLLGCTNWTTLWHSISQGTASTYKTRCIVFCYEKWRTERGGVKGGSNSTHIGRFSDRSTVKHALQNTQNDCHQWLSDSSRVHRIRFRPWLCPDPAGGTYSAPREPLAASWFNCGGRKDRMEVGREEGGKNCVEPLHLYFLRTPLVTRLPSSLRQTTREYLHLDTLV